MARAPKTDAPADPNAPAKPKRVVGPRTAFLIFKAGTPAEVVQNTSAHLEEITLNSRKLINALTGGTPKQFLQYKVQVDPRDGGNGEGEGDAQA